MFFPEYIFKTEIMREIYASFPEMSLVDATHKLYELLMPHYIVLTEDGNGESEIVAVWLVVNEDESSIKQMVALFKNTTKIGRKHLSSLLIRTLLSGEFFKMNFLMQNC